MTSTITECYSGPVLGRLFRLRVVAVDTDANDTFKITAAVEFRN